MTQTFVPEMKQLLELVHYDPKNQDPTIELGARLVITGLLARVARAYNLDIWCVGTGESDLAPGFYWQSCAPGCLPDSEPFGPYATRYECLDAAIEGLLDDHTMPAVGDRVSHTPTKRRGTVMLTRPGYSFVNFGEMGQPFTWVVNGELELLKMFDTGEPQAHGYVNQG